MKQQFLAIFFILLGGVLFSQEIDRHTYTLDVNYFYGSILVHNKDIAHLVKKHPEGFMLSYNRKTFGDKRWQQEYNYPDWGFSTLFNNSKNETLGNNYGVYAHLNFYFIKRNLQFRVAQGLAYNTNPFDFDTNIKNNAYGSHLLSSTYILLNYSKENIFKNIGIQAGISFVHYSNANVKAPNSSTNTIAMNVGLNYTFNNKEREFLKDTTFTKFKEPIKFNLVIRGGINESDYLNLGQHPFWVFSAYADKRLSYKSTLTGGAELFLAKFLEKEIEYLAASEIPGINVKGDEDYKRVGVFIGHDLHIHKFSIVTQLGYYVYYPYDFEGRVYQRIGLKYFITKNIFGVVSLKAHGAKAEAVEFGIGYRF